MPPGIDFLKKNGENCFDSLPKLYFHLEFVSPNVVSFNVVSPDVG